MIPFVLGLAIGAAVIALYHNARNPRQARRFDAALVRVLAAVKAQS